MSDNCGSAQWVSGVDYTLLALSIGVTSCTGRSAVVCLNHWLKVRFCVRPSPHVFDMAAFCDCTCGCRIATTTHIMCPACWKGIGNQCGCLLSEFDRSDVAVKWKKYREGFCHQCNWHDLPYANRYFLYPYKKREEISRSPKPSKRKTDLKKKAPST